MTHETLQKLIVVLTREVARLRGESCATKRITDEVQILDKRLDHLDAAEIQIQKTHEFYTYLESLDPAFAARFDNRVPRDFDTDATPDDSFPE